MMRRNGLMSFAEGTSSSTLQSVSVEDQVKDQARNEAADQVEDQARDHAQDEARDQAKDEAEDRVMEPGKEEVKEEGQSTSTELGQQLENPHFSLIADTHSLVPQLPKPAAPIRTRSDRQHTLSDLQESALPMTAKDLFARAADIMRQSNDMSGVMFIDASYAATGLQGTQPTDSGKHCKILGFATDDRSSLKGDVLPPEMTPRETNFMWVLDQYPHGYTLSYDGAEDIPCNEQPLPNEPVPDTTDTLQQNKQFQLPDKDRAQHRARVKALVPNIKSALFLPLWYKNDTSVTI
jgi:hypothetical protein